MAKKVVYVILYLLTQRIGVYSSGCRENVANHLKNHGFILIKNSGGIYRHKKSDRLAQIKRKSFFPFL